MMIATLAKISTLWAMIISFSVPAYATSHCTSACADLAYRREFRTVFPRDDNLTVWDAKQQQVHSACRVLPTSAGDVAIILRTVIDHDCNFAVKSGGHARDPNDSISVGGITIDLQQIRTVEISVDRSRARLGSGHVLHSMYEALEAYNLTALGGRVADVGLGGFTLGGGVSRLSPQHGLAMDNVLEYEIVLPNTTIALVNEQSHPDLYFALRGGMNNFGIVTHFTVRVFGQGQVYGGSRVYSSDKQRLLNAESFELTTTWKNDTLMAFWYSFDYDPVKDDFTIAFNQEYAEATLEPRPFAQLNEIPYQASNLRLDWVSNFSKDGVSPPGGRQRRNLYATVTHDPSVDLDMKLQDILVDEAKAAVAGSSLTFRPSLVSQPIYEASIRGGEQRGGSAGRIHARGPLTAVLLIVEWYAAELDGTMEQLAANWVKRATDVAKAAGKHNPWLYINYASKHQNPFLGYGSANWARLKQIQRQIDKKGHFTSQGLCRGFFKLN